MRIRLAHLITGLDVGGAEMMLVRLLGQLDRARFDNHVISLLPEGPLAGGLANTGIPVTTLGMKRGQPSPLAMARLVRRLRELRPDVLQTWMYHADVLGLICGRLAGVPHVVWNVRASVVNLDSYGSALTRRIGATLSTRPDAVVVNSEAGLREHKRLGYRPRRWALIPNGIDTAVFKPDPEARRTFRHTLGLHPSRQAIGMVARFDPLKGHAPFIEACRRLRAIQPDFDIILAGRNVTPDNAELRAWIAAAQLGDRLYLLGERADVPALLASLDVYVMASVTEGFPTAVAEAMACGLPSVVTDVGDARSLVGDTGWVVPAGDPEALAGALASALAAGADSLITRGQAARRRISADFALGRIAEMYASLYASL